MRHEYTSKRYAEYVEQNSIDELRMGEIPRPRVWVWLKGILSGALSVIEKGILDD